MNKNIINIPISREVLFEKYSTSSMFKEFFKDYFEGAEIIELDMIFYLNSVFYVKNKNILIEIEHDKNYKTYVIWLNKERCIDLLKELNVSYLQFKQGLRDGSYIVFKNNKKCDFQIEHMESNYFEIIEEQISKRRKTNKFSSFLKNLFHYKQAQ